MTKIVATHATFKRILGGAETTVPIAEAAEFQQRSPGHSLKSVTWEDGSWSWAKVFWFSGSDVVCRIGAGAYGDLIVWEHPVSPYDAKARKEAGIGA